MNFTIPDSELIEVKVKEQKLLAEQVLAGFINKLSESFSPQKEKNLVVTYPSCATTTQFKALKRACDISGIKADLIDESKATAFAYAYDKMSEIRQRERVVAFIDIGHSKTTLTVVRFKK